MEVFNRDHLRTGWGWFRESEKNLFFVSRNRDQFHLIELLDSTLNEASFFNIGSEFIDEVLDLTNFFLLICVGFSEDFQLLLTFIQVISVIPFIGIERSEFKLKGFVGHRIEKSLVVRYHDDSPLIIF